jgi:hypothetical protein
MDDPRALAWQLVAYDARLALAAVHNDLGTVELLYELREKVAFERYRMLRANSTSVDRPRVATRKLAS